MCEKRQCIGFQAVKFNKPDYGDNFFHYCECGELGIQKRYKGNSPQLIKV